jgi:hypothetical protein
LTDSLKAGLVNTTFCIFKNFNASDMSAIVSKILQRIKQPELLSVLTSDLSGSELNSLLLEVFSDRTSKMTAPQLLNDYQKNRFVKPADLPVIELKRMELDLLELFQRHSFDPVELSPVSVLGSCSVVAPADQKKILSALRGTEVLADATNAIALHVSDLKQTNLAAAEQSRKMKFSTFHRHLRTQSISGKGFTPHFKIGCLVTCGVDTGSFTFEKESLNEHARLMAAIFQNYFHSENIGFRLLCRQGYERSEDLVHECSTFIRSQNPGIDLTIIENPEKKNSYYSGLQYKVDIRINGKVYEIGDGGFVNWTQQLLQNKKERMLSTGFGFEFMYRLQTGAI